MYSNRSFTLLRAAARPTFQLRLMSTSTEPLVLSSRSAKNNVVILTLNRPKALNALSSPLFDQLNEELVKADEDDSVKAIVLTGGEKNFAAGADIKEMKDKQCEWDRPSLGFFVVWKELNIVADAYKNNFLGSWTKMSSIRKPIVGAVAGYAVSRGTSNHSSP